MDPLQLWVDAPETLDWLAALLDPAPKEGRERALSLLARADLDELARATPLELERIHGLTPIAARRIAAAFGLARRAAARQRPRRRVVSSAREVDAEVREVIVALEQETLLALLLDGRHRIVATHLVSLGTLSASLVHPREVFRPAVRAAAGAIVVCHNHPSGDPEPSREDLDVTRRLLEAGRVLGIPLLDHVVVADAGFVSLRERIDFDSGLNRP